MSKTNNTHRVNIRWQLLASVSAAALLASAYGAGNALAADSDRPTIWIELGGQLEGLSDAQEPYTPPFAPLLASEGMLPASRVQTLPRFGLAADGSISFQPDDSNWVFSASIRYGRSQSGKKQHQQFHNGTFPVHFSFYGSYQNIGTKYPSSHVKFENASAKQSERHVILDFQTGKDIGLGLFGKNVSSVLSAGVRIAQFSSKANLNMRVEPDVHYNTKPITTFPAFLQFYFYGSPVHFHDFAVTTDNERSFHGIGPSMSWKASLPFAGNPDAGEMTLDWGVNAAFLFGRQTANGHSQTITKTYYRAGFVQSNNAPGVGQPGIHNGAFHRTASLVQHTQPGDHDRTRSVTVPNLGGFAGISLAWPNAKLSLGYRADFFVGAIDGGIDTRKSENRAFYGPYASISIGIGD